MRISVLLFLIFLLVQNDATAQSSWSYGGEYKTGVLAAHRSIIAHVPKEKVHALKFSLSKNIEIPAFAKKGFDGRCGYSAIISTSGNRELVGSFYGLSSFGELPILAGKKWALYNHSSMGIGYVQKVYDEINNPLNNVVSTHFNALIELGLESRFKLKSGDFFLKCDVTHLSNGSLKLPNFGLNYFFVGAGYVHNIAPPAVKIDQVFTSFSNLEIQAIYGAKSTFFSDQKKHGIYALNLAFQKIKNERLGVEFSLDGVYKLPTRFQYPELDINNKELFQLGLFAGHVMSFNRVSTILGMGVYLIDPLQPQDALYHRVGLRYAVTNKLKASLVLKANWGKADYFEWGVFYSLNNSK